MKKIIFNRQTLPYLITCFFVLSPVLQVQAKSRKTVQNDFNTPLHLLQADYKFPYGIPQQKDIQSVLERVLVFLEESTSTQVLDGKTQQVLSDYSRIDADARLQQGAFRLASYEWGVTYMGMLSAGQALSNQRFTDYTLDRFRFLAETAPYFRQQMEAGRPMDSQMRQMLQPAALDDCGSMCAAMIKAAPLMPDTDLKPLINNYVDYIMRKQSRLSDGTLSRNRPFFNSVWLDDLFMSLPALVQMGRYGSDRRYYDEACRQFKLFAEKMFVPGQGLFRHAWVQGMDSHPDFFWGRANGWALMTLVEILEVLPESHPQRAYLLDMLRAQIKALAALQSPEGLWHQLLDRNDTYLETSASAIFCYAFAKAINRGWVDAQAYGPAVLLAWNAVAAKVDAQGMVQGTCVGTGMAFDPAFYAHRPVSPYAAHGYGPVLLAGAEVLRLLENFHPKMNDSAVQFYTHHFNTTAPIFEERIENNHGLKVPGYSRRGRRPVVFTIGDSTVRNSDGSGRNGQWGWGNFLGDFLNPDSFSVENHALGGRSSRTFIEEGLWQRVLDVVEEGDYVLMQFGHNDGGEPHRGRARATLKGNGDQAESFVMESTGDTILVHTYGWYMRRYIQDVLDKKAVPVVCSLIPRNIWQDGKVGRNDDTYALWAQQAAESIEGAYFIDLNKLICDKYDVLGKNFVNTLYYGDHTHTSELGAKMNAAIVAEEFKRLIQEK